MQDPKFALEPKEREALARARADVKALVTASEEALNLCTQAPVPGSPLAIAVGSDIERLWVTTATSAINVSVDNLRALSVAWTAEQGVPHSAGYTLIRSATEAAARACWLATPGVSPRVRAARGIVEWDYSIECFRHLDEDGEHRKRLRSRLERMIRPAGLLLEGKNFRCRSCEGEIRPGNGDVVKGQLPGKRGASAYSMLSGYAHAEVWVMRMDWAPVDADRVVVLLNVKRHLDTLRGTALRVLNGAMCSMIHLAGHDVDAWKARAIPLVLGHV